MAVSTSGRISGPSSRSILSKLLFLPSVPKGGWRLMIISTYPQVNVVTRFLMTATTHSICSLSLCCTHLFMKRGRPFQTDQQEEHTKNHEVDDDRLLQCGQLSSESAHGHAGDGMNDDAEDPREVDDRAECVVGILDYIEELELPGTVVGQQVGVLNLKC